jgi:hypothetical protein
VILIRKTMCYRISYVIRHIVIISRPSGEGHLEMSETCPGPWSVVCGWFKYLLVPHGRTTKRRTVIDWSLRQSRFAELAAGAASPEMGPVQGPRTVRSFAGLPRLPYLSEATERQSAVAVTRTEVCLLRRQ